MKIKSGFNVVIPTYNSENTIFECISRLNFPFIEIYVVDSESSDRTKELCSKFDNVNFINFKWNKKYPKKRNWTLFNVDLKYDWVLFLDSDEFVNENLIHEIGLKINNYAYKGYWIEYENYFNNKILKYGIKQKKLALFNKKFGKYEKIQLNYDSNLDMEIHEHPVINGPVSTLKYNIRHQDIRPLSNLLAKHIDYAIWENYRVKEINNWSVLTLRQKLKYKLISSIFFPFIYFFMNYFIYLGFLDGKNGLNHSLFKFNYFLNIYLLLSENDKK